MFKSLSIAALSAVASASADGKCRGLAMSGGANYGAWEVGVIWGLMHYGNPEDYTWDVITGVSAGAINTAGTLVYETGDEYAMSEFLSDSWAHLHSSDIWRFWPDETPREWFSEQGLLDSSPAIEYITELIAPFGEIKRNFAFSAVDVNSGEYVVMDQTNTLFEEVP